MLQILENKVKEKINDGRIRSNKLKTKLQICERNEIEIRNLLGNYKNINDSKKRKKIIYLLTVLATFLMLVNPWFSLANIYLIFALINENLEIKDNFEQIINSDYKNLKDEKSLKKSLYEVVKKEYNINEQIRINNNQIDKYKKVNNDIEYVKNLEKKDKQQGDLNFNLLKDLYSTLPILAFDTKEEYNNYLSYDNEFIKDEIINSKILEKKRK